MSANKLSKLDEESANPTSLKLSEPPLRWKTNWMLLFLIYQVYLDCHVYDKTSSQLTFQMLVIVLEESERSRLNNWTVTRTFNLFDDNIKLHIRVKKNNMHF